MLTRREVQRFFLLGSVLLGVAWGLVLPWLHGRPPHAGVLATAALAGLCGVLWPERLRPLATALQRLLAIIGHANGVLLLSLVFCLVLVPTALLRRVRRRQPAVAGSSYYAPPPERRPADMTRMF